MKTRTLEHIEHLIARYPNLESVKEQIINAVEILITTFKNGGKGLIMRKWWFCC